MNYNNKKYTIISIFVVIIAIIFILPIVLIFLNTFKGINELYNPELNIIPDDWTLENYRNALSEGGYGRYLLNSTIVAVVGTFLTVIISAMAGYGLSHYKFNSNKWVMIMIMATVMIPVEVILMPVFQMIKLTGLYDSLWGVIIPCIATPTGILIMRQQMLSIPHSLVEAARVEGMGEMKIFMKIIFPLAKTTVATLAIFSFMWRWNDYIYPLVVLSSPEKYTIQLAISQFAGENSTDWGALLAVSTIAAIPVIIVFVVFQKHFMSGIASSGSKE